MSPSITFGGSGRRGDTGGWEVVQIKQLDEATRYTAFKAIMDIAFSMHQRAREVGETQSATQQATCSWPCWHKVPSGVLG